MGAIHLHQPTGRLVTAFEQLEELWQGESAQLGLEIQSCLFHGAGIWTPENLAFIRPVCSDWQDHEIENPSKTIGLTESVDCWYVFAAIGDMKYLISLIPYPLEWIAFSRVKPERGQSTIRRYNFQRFASHGKVTESP